MGKYGSPQRGVGDQTGRFGELGRMRNTEQESRLYPAVSGAAASPQEADLTGGALDQPAVNNPVI